MGAAEQLTFRLRDSWETRKSFADYSPEERRINDALVLRAHTEHVNLSPELRHYEILKSLASGK